MDLDENISAICARYIDLDGNGNIVFINNENPDTTINDTDEHDLLQQINSGLKYNYYNSTQQIIDDINTFTYKLDKKFNEVIKLQNKLITIRCKLQSMMDNKNVVDLEELNDIIRYINN